MKVLILLMLFTVATTKWVKEMENPGLYEGDIILTPDQEKAAKKGMLGYASTRYNHWDKTIYYDWDSELANNRGVLAAIADYHKYTCLRFVKRTNNQPNYMYFQRGRGGCSSGVGYFGNGRHSINLGPGCRGKGTVLHEMAHRLGIYHEQSRPDRDNYITIQWDNITPSMKYNFGKQSTKNIDSLGTKYDYRSIMHYADWGFSKNGKPTMLTKDPAMQKVIGNRQGFSDIDKIQINRLYKCNTVSTQKPTTQKPVTWPPSGRGYILRHSGGKCLDVNKDHELILTSACNKRFVEINGNTLSVAGQLYCAYPTGWNREVKFDSQCKYKFAKTYITSDGYFSIKSLDRNRCLHPKGGSSNPSEGTKVVTYYGCNGRRLQFKQE